MSNQPLSIAEVCEIKPGPESRAAWIDSLIGIVNSIDKKTAKLSGKSFWICVLGDTTGSAKATMSVFTAPKFSAGSTIVVSGKGIRRTEYNGAAQINIGKETKINVVAESEHSQNQEDVPYDTPSQSAPARHSAPQPGDKPVIGVTVGMSINNALTLLTSKLTHDEIVARIITPVFWFSVHEVASDIIRMSRLLESGKLAPAIRERTGDTAQPMVQKPTAPTSVRQVRKPTPAQDANVEPADDSSEVPS